MIVGSRIQKASTDSNYLIWKHSLATYGDS